VGGEIDLVDLVDLGVGVGVGVGVLESLAPVVDAASLVGDLDGRRLDVVEFGNVVVALDMMVESDVPVRLLLLLPSGTTTTLAEVVRWATRVAERQMAAFTAIARADMMVSGRTDTRTRLVKATMVAQ
jgi:hypothetical protein